MKKEFSKYWKSSKMPRKQRKYTAKAPQHRRKKFLSVNITKNLRKKYAKRNIPVRKGDTVKVMRGKFAKKQGKVISVDYKRLKVFVEGIQIKKRDGSSVQVGLYPSNLQIVSINTDDKKRQKILGESEKKVKKLEKEITKKENLGKLIKQKTKKQSKNAFKKTGNA